MARNRVARGQQRPIHPLRAQSYTDHPVRPFGSHECLPRTIRQKSRRSPQGVRFPDRPWLNTSLGCDHLTGINWGQRGADPEAKDSACPENNFKHRDRLIVFIDEGGLSERRTPVRTWVISRRPAESAKSNRQSEAVDAAKMSVHLIAMLDSSH
jgi:hypothetical protein